MAALSPDHRLWVPMQVQSLVFGKPGTAAFLDLTPRYEELGDRQQAPLARRLRPKLDRTTARPAFLPPGIHLHWMLPAAFTHLRPAEDGKAPRVPNRWLVTRLWIPDGKLKLRCWVVESDTVSDDGAVPWLDDQLDPTLRLGLTSELGNWTEPGTADPAFGAFAPGNLAFAASYPSCHGVFGFHDDCKGLPAGTVCTYLVNGWFSDPAADPLNVEIALSSEVAEPEARWTQRMEQLRWAVDKDATFRPTAVTCYAIAPAIAWTPDAECTTAGQPNVGVAVGGSFAEAVATLARGNGTSADRDGLVSLHQLAVLNEREPTESDLTPDFFRVLARMPGARARLHERTFGARDGGTFWEIVPAERNAEDRKADAAPVVLLPPDLADRLAELNSLQAQRDETHRALAAARDRLFLAWYQLQHWTIRSTEAASPEQARRLSAAMAACAAEVSGAEAQLAGLEIRRDAGEAALRARIAEDAPELVLISRAMPRFWQPADPFVLTAGLQIPAVQDGTSPLLCRVSNQAVSGIEGRIGVLRGTLESYLEEYLQPVQNLPIGMAGIPPDWLDLLLDAIFVDGGMARVLALASLKARVTDPGERQISEARDAISVVQAPISTAADAVNRGRPEAADGLLLGLDGVALRSLLSAIWLPTAAPRPVFMVWKASWRPHGGAGRLPGAGWELPDDSVDYRWSGALPDGESQGIDGFLPVATGLERGLGPTRKQFPEPDIAFVFAGLDRLAGQTLAGLNAALATRDVSAQLQPLARLRTGLALDPVDALVAGQHVAGPLTGDREASPFAPVRGGEVELTRLWIVDSFGRVQRLLDSDDKGRPAPIIARSLAGSGSASILMPPRLVQPARMRLAWQSARHEAEASRGDLETSPVCGFVLHNRLDRSLLVYGSRDGSDPMPDTLLGAVQPVRLAHGREVVRWCMPPARPFSAGDAAGGPGRLTAAGIPNRHLRGFVNGLLARFGGEAGRGFEDFRNLLARHEEGADLSRGHGVQAMLVGRPLALVRASLRLELEAPPVVDQNWRAILGDPPAPWFRDLAFAVRIGDRRLGAEGLVGLFVDDGTEAAYRTLQLRADLTYPRSITGHPYFSSAALRIPCDPAAPPVSLTLLLDPRRPTHLVSGVLPALTATVPEGPIAAGLAGLEIPFLVAPLLGELAPSTGRSMPLPTNSHDEWRWVSFPDPRSPAVEVPVSGDTAAAGSLQAAKALHEGWLRYCPPKRGNR